MDINALPGQFFGMEVRRARESGGWSQSGLSELIGYSDTLIGYIETGRRTPTERFAAACDNAFETGDYFSRLCCLVRQFGTPGVPLDELLASATSLQISDPLFIPVLAQTDDYARAVMAASCLPDNQISGLMASRVRLADLLERSAQLSSWIVIDETTLYRPVGNRETLRLQMKELISLIDTGRVIVQVLKTTSPMVPLLRLPQVIMGFPDGTSLAHVPNLVPDDSTDRCMPAKAHVRAFDLLRAAALPPGISQGAIARAAN